MDDEARLREAVLRATAPALQHELNNALMVANANIEMLARHVPEGPPRRQLDRVAAAMRRLDETVRCYLDALRRAPGEAATIAPTEVVAAALPLLRTALGAQFGFDLEAGDTLAPVCLDRARLELALLGLARDAATRMAPGARIVARGEARAGDVALVLTLPEGAAPVDAAVLFLLERGAMRLERGEGRLALVWDRPAP